jgi:hypothetical protein
MIPAHHTESKMLSARKAVWPSGDYKEIRSIIVRRSRAIHQLRYGPLPQCSDLVGIGGEADVARPPQIGRSRPFPDIGHKVEHKEKRRRCCQSVNGLPELSRHFSCLPEHG